MEVTWGDLGKWILTLPDHIQNAQVWYIDIGKLNKAKRVEFYFSPSKDYAGMEELIGEGEKTD